MQAVLQSQSFIFFVTEFFGGIVCCNADKLLLSALNFALNSGFVTFRQFRLDLQAFLLGSTRSVFVWLVVGG
jgi:hypothetical protein